MAAKTISLKYKPLVEQLLNNDLATQKSNFQQLWSLYQEKQRLYYRDLMFFLLGAFLYLVSAVALVAAIATYVYATVNKEALYYKYFIPIFVAFVSALIAIVVIKLKAPAPFMRFHAYLFWKIFKDKYDAEQKFIAIYLATFFHHKWFFYDAVKCMCAKKRVNEKTYRMLSDQEQADVQAIIETSKNLTVA